jgi:hypothetical protein
MAALCSPTAVTTPRRATRAGQVNAALSADLEGIAPATERRKQPGEAGSRSLERVRKSRRTSPGSGPPRIDQLGYFRQSVTLQKQSVALSQIRTWMRTERAVEGFEPAGMLVMSASIFIAPQWGDCDATVSSCLRLRELRSCMDGWPI